MRDPIRLVSDEAPLIPARVALTEHARGREVPPDLPAETSPEVREIVRKYKLLVGRERKFGWFARKVRFWLGIHVDQTTFADTANALFTKEVEERQRMQ